MGVMKMEGKFPKTVSPVWHISVWHTSGPMVYNLKPSDHGCPNGERPLTNDFMINVSRQGGDQDAIPEMVIFIQELFNLMAEGVSRDDLLSAVRLMVDKGKPATPDPVSEAAKVTSNDLYYLRAVMRRMNEFHEALADESAFSLGGQALADECDWLTDFVYRHERALTKDGKDG